MLNTNAPANIETPASDSASREETFSYAPGIGKIVFGVLFFGAGGLMMLHAATTNRKGLVIDGFIHLSPENACNFYFWVAAVAFAFVIYTVGYILPQSFIPRQIILQPDAITLPDTGFGKGHFRLEPSQILGFSITVVKGHRFLKIRTAQRTFTVNPMWLSYPGDFEQIARWLQSHVTWVM